MPRHKPDNPPPTETDPRFPSGPWTGFWIQTALGRQRMHLSLAFAAGQVTGHGVDIVGRFTFTGTYDLNTGRCQMTKQYEAAHRVEYEGVNEADGLWLWGLWSMPAERGGFHLWPEGEPDPTRRRLKTQKELPASEPAEQALVEMEAP
jgi:hypothetical protein